MNAYEIPGLRFSLLAGANISRRRFVTVTTDGSGVVATASLTPIGVSMNEVKTGEVLEVADGIVIVEASAAIAAGAKVASTTGGMAVTAGTDAPYAGIALTSSTAAGQYITVKM